jgi:hypothetical protein
MVILIVLNVVLIIFLIFLVLYIFRKKYNVTKKSCVVDKTCIIDENKIVENKQKNNKKQERVFVGRFVTDEEYKQMMKNRRSDISILMEELNNEYEHFKELSK